MNEKKPVLKWQQKIMDQESSMSNKDLLDEVLSQATGDGYDGCFTERGLWEYRYLEIRLRERLAGWLEK